VRNGIHFISGLPRSGSTRLAALLLQNPAVHAGITSPLGSLVGTMLREISQGNETAVMIDDAQRQTLLRGLFDSYYHAIHPARMASDASGYISSRPFFRRQTLSTACGVSSGSSTASSV
jgi:sulfotransferase